MIVPLVDDVQIRREKLEVLVADLPGYERALVIAREQTADPETAPFLPRDIVAESEQRVAETRTRIATLRAELGPQASDLQPACNDAQAVCEPPCDDARTDAIHGSAHAQIDPANWRTFVRSRVQLARCARCERCRRFFTWRDARISIYRMTCPVCSGKLHQSVAGAKGFDGFLVIPEPQRFAR